MTNQHEGISSAGEVNHGRRSASRLRVAGGLALLVVGLICIIPGVPGPGAAMILVALVMLSDHFEWAGKALAWLRAKARAAHLPEWALAHLHAHSAGKPGHPSGDERASGK